MVNIIELKTTQTNAIKILIETLNALLTDINITFYPYYIGDKNNKKVGGLLIKELNKTNSVLIQCKLDADQFEQYKYNYNGTSYTISINLNNFLKCLKCMTNFDTMTLIIDDEDSNKLQMILENEKDKKTFKINLMELDENSDDIESVNMTYCVTLPSVDFQKYCKDMASATDKLDIRCTDNILYFAGKGELGHIEFEIDKSKGGLYIEKTNNDENKIVQGLFELKYLLIFTKCTNLCNQVNLYLTNNFPIIIKYSVAALGEIKLVLTPCQPSHM